MTATGILDHSARIEQSLIELNTSAFQVGEQVHFLEKQIISQLSQFVIELDKEIHHPKKFIRFYDLEKFYQWNERHLNKFNKTLLKLFLEIRNYEKLLHNYYLAILQIKQEVADA